MKISGTGSRARRQTPWPTSVSEARAIQQRLRRRVIRRDRIGQVRYVAGVDVGFARAGTVTRAAVALLVFPELTLAEYAIARERTRFPYVPGYLSFREVPAILTALEKLKTRPDLILCDGQGYAHPRRFGLACHLGVLTGIPTIGVAKSRLIGESKPLPGKRGSWVPLTEQGETIGAVLRTRDDIKPVYVSVGHRVSLPTAIDYVLKCTVRYRLPQTTRIADRLAAGLPPEKMVRRVSATESPHGQRALQVRIPRRV